MMKIYDLTPEERTDLTDRLRNRPGHVTAAEKSMLAGVLERLAITRGVDGVNVAVVLIIDYVEGRDV